MGGWISLALASDPDLKDKVIGKDGGSQNVIFQSHHNQAMLLIRIRIGMDPDPFHLAGSGSVSVSDDPDPGSAKNKPKP